MAIITPDLAHLSGLAYNQPAYIQDLWNAHADPVLSRATRPPEFVQCERCDAQCYLMYFGDLLAICVRGTSSFQDWLCDGQIDLVPFKNCKATRLPGVLVHAGFFLQYVGLFSAFDERVKSHLADGGKLFCTGHSLGAAVGALAALNYGSGFKGTVSYEGFGCPRVGNAAFATAFNACVLLRVRVKNGADPVPSIIPPVLGYTHAGSEVHIGPVDSHPDIPLLTSIADHAISNYEAGLSDQKKPAPAATKLGLCQEWVLKVMDAYRWNPPVDSLTVFVRQGLQRLAAWSAPIARFY